MNDFSIRVFYIFRYSGYHVICFDSDWNLVRNVSPLQLYIKNCASQNIFYKTLLLSVIIFILQHAFDCGAGTGIFLVVTSSNIIVIHGKRACVWGSVYLDSFGEEDRELKYVVNSIFWYSLYLDSESESL